MNKTVFNLLKKYIENIEPYKENPDYIDLVVYDENGNFVTSALQDGKRFNLEYIFHQYYYYCDNRGYCCYNYKLVYKKDNVCLPFANVYCRGRLLYIDVYGGDNRVIFSINRHHCYPFQYPDNNITSTHELWKRIITHRMNKNNHPTHFVMGFSGSCWEEMYDCNVKGILEASKELSNWKDHYNHIEYFCNYS